ncbi:hypothetical protein [Paractinoplanes maris]|uniref:hypothetical protein n=1 Tax=Paractinoplanes maris TaxID=1734446 RepID=UPI0020228302|nr:hypothetical protein [Actinoplanes maris]
MGAQLDPLRLTIDVRGLGISGYQAAEWLRAVSHVDMGSADQCHLGGQVSYADDDDTEQRLVESLRRLVDERGSIESQPQADLPEPRTLELENVMLPGDAFFGRTEQVPTDQATGRIAADPTMKSVRVVAE